MLKKSLNKIVLAVMFLSSMVLFGCRNTPSEVFQQVFVEFPIHVADEATFGAWDLTNDTPPPAKAETLE